MARTPRQFLIESAAIKFGKWNHAAIRLEAGVPVPQDVSDWQRLEKLHEEGHTGPAYIVREPMTPDMALEATAQELEQTYASASREERDSIYAPNIDAAEWYRHASDSDIDMAIREVHTFGMTALDVLILRDGILEQALEELEALGAAKRIFRGQGDASMADLDLALAAGLIEWESQVGLFRAIPSWKFVEWERSYEVRTIGGVLPRLPRVLMRKVAEGRYQSDRAARL